MPEICVILNAHAGERRSAEKRREIERALKAAGSDGLVRTIGRGGSIERETQRAIDEDYRVIVAAGGDGTINAVVEQVAAAERTLGVIPLGTFNFLARRLGLPLDVDEATRVAVGGEERSIALGDVNGRGFVNNASLGVYAAILARRERMYDRWGRSRLVAHASVAMTLASFSSPLRMRIVVDGAARQVRSPLAFVANNAYQLERFGLPPGEDVGEGRLALLLAPDVGPFGLLRAAVELARGGLEAGRDFEQIIGTEILIETEQKSRTVARDGERDRMTSPFRFRSRPDALRVRVPACKG